MTDQKKLKQLEQLLKSADERLHAHASKALAKEKVKKAIHRDQKAEAEAAAAKAAARKYA